MNPKFKFYNFSNNKMLYHSLRMFGSTWWVFYYSKRFGWFRLFGAGLKWKDSSIYKDKGLKIGNWVLNLTIKKF